MDQAKIEELVTQAYRAGVADGRNEGRIEGASLVMKRMKERLDDLDAEAYDTAEASGDNVIAFRK